MCRTGGATTGTCAGEVRISLRFQSLILNLLKATFHEEMLGREEILLREFPELNQTRTLVQDADKSPVQNGAKI